MLKLKCRKFSRLSDQGRDRELTPGEHGFLSSHRLGCVDCAAREDQTDSAMAELRDITLEAEPSAGFDERLMKAYREGRNPTGFGYWSPAVMGAAIAGIAVLCALTIVSRTAESPIRHDPNGAAFLIRQGSNHQFPNLNLDGPASPAP